jgi:hypothetical protein
MASLGSVRHPALLSVIRCTQFDTSSKEKPLIGLPILYLASLEAFLVLEQTQHERSSAV